MYNAFLMILWVSKVALGGTTSVYGFIWRCLFGYGREPAQRIDKRAIFDNHVCFHSAEVLFRVDEL